MDTERVKELKTFTNDFNLKLKNAFDQFNNNDKKAIEDAKRSLTESQNSLTPKKKKKTFSSTAFNEKLPWKPNHVYNRYFEKFKKITPLHDLNSWEILRVNNLSKRSFEKEKDPPFKKDMYPCHGVAREFTKTFYDYQNTETLY